LEDYVKAIPILTIDSNSSILQKQVEELADKTTTNDYLLKAKLQEKDDALVTLSDHVMKLMAEVQELKKQKNNAYQFSSCPITSDDIWKRQNNQEVNRAWLPT